MGQALALLEVEGVATNRELLARIIAHPRFVAGDVSTTWLAEALR
jgi:biotin carboxylase